MWTTAHEIGHILLRHLEDFGQTDIRHGLTEIENSILEKEADAFASEFLASSEILLHCRCVSKDNIIKLCGLSGKAAENKERNLQRYKPDNKSQHLNISIPVLK